ncbi:MAG: YraN family protein [Alphaproteobacteria bacterium]
MSRSARQRARAEARGRRAEVFAAIYLIAKGYRILTRRFKCNRGEIDLVARRGRALVFVEVKYRADLAQAAFAVTPAGQRRIAAAARLWLAKHPNAAGLDLRFDAILLSPRTWPRHIMAAFNDPLDL